METFHVSPVLLMEAKIKYESGTKCLLHSRRRKCMGRSLPFDLFIKPDFISVPQSAGGPRTGTLN